jgi:hypothetical protein
LLAKTVRGGLQTKGLSAPFSPGAGITRQVIKEVMAETSLLAQLSKGGLDMAQPTEVTAALLPGIVDLPRLTRFHLARAFIAEAVGNHLIAAFELTQAVAAEAQETNELEVQ